MHGTNSSRAHDPPTPAAGADRRRHRRADVRWSAQLDTADGFYDCVVRNLSWGGAKLALIAGLVPGQAVRLAIARGGTLRAAVVWIRYGAIGIRFTEPPDLIAAAIRRRAGLGRS
jgi:hypothetical protein